LGWSEESLISGNSINDNWGGLYFRESSRLSVRDNQISGNQISSLKNPISLIDFTWIYDRAIIMLEGVSDSQIVGNHIIDNSGIGFVLTGSRNLISENVVQGNSYGFFIGGFGFSDNNVIKRNDFLDNLDEDFEDNFNSQAIVNGQSNIIVFNHWSDWISPDSDTDGYVDIPYLLDGQQDNPSPPQDSAPLAEPNPPKTHLIIGPELIHPTGTLKLSGSIFIQWTQAQDSHDYLLSYSLYFSDNLGKKWKQLNDNPLITTVFEWDTSNHYDSTSCLLKVVTQASDGLSEETISSVEFSINNGRIKPPPPLSMELRILLLLFLLFSALKLFNTQKKQM